MIHSIEQSTTHLYLLLLVCIIIIVSGCAGSKIAPDLLAQVEKQHKPLVNNAVTIAVEINPAINNYEEIDQSVKESLEIALLNANIFGADFSHPYRISATIMVASQAGLSFGSFKGTLQINYFLFDETDKQIIYEPIYTEAGSDKFYFYGPSRHQRARAVNISKNVLQFVDIVQRKLKK